MANDRPDILFVTRGIESSAHAGDQVLTRHMIAFLERTQNVKRLDLQRGGIANKLADLARGWLPELSGYATIENRLALSAALDPLPSHVILAHESLFPLASVVAGRADVTLYAHNSPSRLSATDPSVVQRQWCGAAMRFEKRYFFQPRTRLIFVSESDRDWLTRNHHQIVPHNVATPGAPHRQPALRPGARFVHDIVISGSYDWWRKRRDLRHFARRYRGPPPLITDSRAAEIFGGKATYVEEADIDFTESVRFGMITDRFCAGFKLKTLQYVAANCVIVSTADLSRDFEGLPHAEKFIRFVPDAQAVGEVVQSFANDDSNTIADFISFKAACMDRFDWNTCLASLTPR